MYLLNLTVNKRYYIIRTQCSYTAGQACEENNLLLYLSGRLSIKDFPIVPKGIRSKGLDANNGLLKVCML